MRKIFYIILCLCSMFLLMACSNKKEGTEMNVFYINIDGNTLVQETYFREADETEKAVEEVLKALKNPENKKDCMSAIPEMVEVEEFTIKNRNIALVFNEEYMKLNRSAEVLLRAAVVQTLAQIPEISLVTFYVGEEMIKDSNGRVIGMMSAEDFVQNTGTSLKSYQSTELKLYFANSDGTKLSMEKRNDVKYSINTSIEKLVVEQLMKGTTSDKRSGTVPGTVKLLGVSVKDGICYVNFDSSFLNVGLNQIPDVTIYSIVNSVIVNGNATKVQILVDGSNDVKFLGSVDLSEPLEWRADLLEE